jgi:hypothetical protein
MKRSLLFVVLVSLFSSLTAQYTVRGGSGLPLLAEDNNQIKVYLLNGLSGAQISFISTNEGTHQWYRYSERGNDAAPIASVQDGNTSYITDVQGGFGYFVGLPTEELPLYVWIIDYSRYIPRFFDLKTEESDDKCTSLKIIADVEAEQINYYLPSGARGNFIRTYNLQYDTQVWLDDSKQFIPKEENMVVRGLISEIVIDAPPLTNTHFTLTGDQFAEYFGIASGIRSEEYRAIAVEAHGIAETSKVHADNEIHLAGDALGGSAPVEYIFTAYANEPVAAFYIWKILQYDSTTNEMTTIVQFTEKFYDIISKRTEFTVSCWK